MKVVAFDISSNNTGWSYIELEKNGKSHKVSHFEYGNIAPSASMNTFQRLYFFGNEINKIISKFEPDEIGVEEAIIMYGHGFKTARTLSRFSGVAFWFAYNYQKKDVHVFEPTQWRKIIGLSGKCHKTEVQLYVVQKLGLLNPETIDYYTKTINDLQNTDFKSLRDLKEKELLDSLKEQKQQIKKLKSKDEASKEIKELELKIKNEIKQLKEQSKKDEKKAVLNINKSLDKLGVDIYSDTGIDNNISDSFGVNFSIIKELKIDIR